MDNSDISTSCLKLIYDGEALNNNEMLADDLILILKSINNLFKEINSEINEDNTDVDVKIKANFHKGCFGIEIIIIVKIILDLFNNDIVSAFINAKDMIVFLQNLFNFIKYTKGKKVQEDNFIFENGKLCINNLENSNIWFEYDEEKIETAKEKETKIKKTYKLYTNNSIRKDVENMISIINRKGIDTLQMEYNNVIKDIAYKNNIDFFKAPPKVNIDIISDNRIEAIFDIKTLSFENKYKWKLHNDTLGSINIKVEDESFLKNIDSNIEKFSKEDQLKVRLRIEKIVTKNNKERSVYFIEKVIKHIKNKEKLLPFDDL